MTDQISGLNRVVQDYFEICITIDIVRIIDLSQFKILKPALTRLNPIEKI